MTSDEWADREARRGRAITALTTVLVGAILTGFALLIVKCARPERAPAPSASAAPALVPSTAPSALPPEKGGPVVLEADDAFWADFDRRTAEARARKTLAVTRCWDAGGVVVSGSPVICVDSKAVMFTFDPEFPPFPKRNP